MSVFAESWGSFFCFCLLLLAILSVGVLDCCAVITSVNVILILLLARFQIHGCVLRLDVQEKYELRNEVEYGISVWEEICYEVQGFEDLCTGFGVVLVDLGSSCFAWRD